MKGDSQVMKEHSQAMKNIAILTMVYLPCTAAAVRNNICLLRIPSHLISPDLL
jgi:hypothetical protein